MCIVSALEKATHNDDDFYLCEHCLERIPDGTDRKSDDGMRLCHTCYENEVSICTKCGCSSYEEEFTGMCPECQKDEDVVVISFSREEAIRLNEVCEDSYQTKKDASIVRPIVSASQKLLKALASLLIVVSFASVSFAAVDMSIIATIESQNNPMAHNAASGCIGTYQINPRGALADWNAYHATKHTASDLYIHEVNEKIARWYINERIPAMLRHYKREVTNANIIRAYNAGIKSVVAGYIPKETANYLVKYQQLGGEL